MLSLTHYGLSTTGWRVLCWLFILQLARAMILHFFGSRMHKISKVRQGNLERGVTWNTAHSSAPYSRTGTVRLASWDGIGRYISALSYRGLEVSDS